MAFRYSKERKEFSGALGSDKKELIKKEKIN